MTESNESSRCDSDESPHFVATRLTQMMEQIQKWKGHTVDTLAQILGVTVTSIQNWESGKTPPPKGKHRLLEELFHEACSSRAVSLLTALNQWGYTETQIARHINIGVAAVCRWLSGETVPNLKHLTDLEMLHANAREKLFDNWLRAHPFRFLCSKSDKHPVGHAAQAMEALHLSQQQALPVSIDNGSFPFTLDLRFEDLPVHVRGHTYLSKKDSKCVFIIILNRNDPFVEQEQTLFVELDAHVLAHFRMPNLDRKQPKRILRTGSMQKDKNYKRTKIQKYEH